MLFTVKVLFITEVSCMYIVDLIFVSQWRVSRIFILEEGYGDHRGPRILVPISGMCCMYLYPTGLDVGHILWLSASANISHFVGLCPTFPSLKNCTISGARSGKKVVVVSLLSNMTYCVKYNKCINF